MQRPNLLYWERLYSPPSVIAPIDEIYELLIYVKTRVDPNKILLGLQNFGLDWALPYISGEYVTEMISNVEAVERAERFGAEIQFNEIVRAPFYRYIDDIGREHEVWFEDVRCLRAKLERS